LRIAETARRHNIADENMLHAVRNGIADWRFDDDFTMIVGPARGGQLLEVGVLGIEPMNRLSFTRCAPARNSYPHR
jgi:hypothetical protein